MSNKRKLKDYNPNDCPVVYSLNKFGDRWKLLIIHHIKKGSNRHSSLMKALPDISRQTLTNKLREMEEDRIVERKVFAEVPPKVEYYLTELGLSLDPIIKEMSQWGLEFVTPKSSE